MPRKLKSQDGNPYDVIRGMWEGAYVSHFLRLFQKKFGFSSLTTQDLEEALVDDESFILADIFARLMRYATDNTDILIVNFDKFLKNILVQEKVVSRLLENHTTWKDLSPEEKLGTLKWLVDHVYQEKEEDIADYLDENYSADDLRGICVGHDAFNNSYWYLDDLRLYREFSYKKQSKKDWECVCFTLSDWQSFIKQFRKTSNLQEKELYSYLNFELYPFIEPELTDINKVQKTKKEKNEFLINEERKELSVMLEKKTDLDGNNSSVKSIVLCSDLENDTGASIDSCENSSSNTIVKSKENSNNLNAINYDGDSQKTKTCPVSNSLATSVMDIKTSTTMCTSSCTSSSTTSCEVSAAVNCGNINSCGQESICSTSVSTASTSITSTEVNQEVSLQQSINDIPSDSSSVTSNKENAPPSSGNIGNDIPPMSAISSMVGTATTPVTSASIQALPSNMVSKTSYQMETQYMQQQSQIFVFSTALANKAAESYLSGNFPSIIAYHCAQPGTKSFLEKYPLKVQQFNRQNPTAWLNSLTQAKQLPGRQIKTTFSSSHTANNSRFPGPSSGSIGSNCTGACSMHNPEICANLRSSWSNNCSGIGSSIPNEISSQSWPSQMGMGINTSAINQRFPGPVHGMNPRQVGPTGNYSGNINANSNVSSFPNSALNSVQMNQVPGCPSSLTGVKVPDFNLTPKQLKHREEQLAMIRKMQQLLFPEQQQMDQVGVGSNMVPIVSGMQNQHTSHPRFPLPDACVPSGVDECFSPHQPCINENDRSHIPLDMYTESPMVGSNLLQQNYPPVSVSAQLEWQKLQNQFYEERHKKDCNSNLPHTNSFPGMQNQSNIQHSTPQPLTPQQSNLNNPSPALGLSPGARIQGPPPPYHQANKRTMPSPHPPSPNTSSLSLPSPLTCSGLPSPADTGSRQFPVPTPPGPKLSHHSPGSTTAGSNSLHTTPLNSPKPGSVSNMTHIRTPTTPSNANSCGTPTSSCAPILSTSSPVTPTTTSTSNFNQSQSCTLDTEDNNSLKTGTSTSSEFSSSMSVTVTNSVQGELHCHNAKSCSQSSQKQDQGSNHCGVCQKEPNLMPVPSPQQIQYLNAFDGQELTIQKQPNTGVRDLDAVSPQSVPPMPVTNVSQSQFQSPDTASFPNTPGSCPSTLENSQDSLSGQCPSSAPASMESTVSRFTAPSPQIPSFDIGQRHVQPSQQNDSSTQQFPVNQNVDMLKNHCSNAVSHNTLLESNRRYDPVSQNPVVSSCLSNTNNLSRFSCSAPDSLQRLRGPGPHGVDIGQARFPGFRSHMRCVDNFTPPSQFSSMGSERATPNQMQTFPGSVPSMTSQNSSCIGGSFLESNISYSHLQNLEKMTPPFENIAGSKLSDVMSPVPQCSNTSVSSSIMASRQYGGTNSLSPSTVSPSQRLAHFDPIASMAAMSDSTVPMVPGTGNAQTHPNVITSNINVPNMQISSTSGNSSANIHFHTDVQSMQGASSSNECTLSNQNHFSMHSQIDNTSGCNNPSNSIYTTTTMPLQQVNGQNVTTCMSYTTCEQGPYVSSNSLHPNCIGSGANTLSCSVTTNHPIMHTSVTTRTSNSNFMGTGTRHALTSFSGPRIAPPPRAGSPSLLPRGPQHFNRTNVQVKANAPNTIQYLPARQQCMTPPHRPPTLEFLQRFAAPLTNLDSKVPTHNLQYFPNSGVSNPHSVPNNMGVNPGSGTVAPMLGNHGSIMMEPMMRRVNSNVSHPSGQVFPVCSGIPSGESPMFGRPPCPSINNQLMPMNSMSGSQGSGMFPNKQVSLSIGGMAPEATQPLPPSMGQTFNYKQSPFYGPTTADPNYAVQFHNFQQQLYATNTRGSQINSQTNMTSQGFFGPK